METQSLANSAAIGIMAGIGMGFIFMIFAFTFFLMACYWKIYSKAGQPGWAIFVPFYNFFVMLRIVNKPWWWFFLLFIPLVNIVIAIIIVHRLSLSFGKGAGFTLGLLFLSIVFVPILAFDNSVYVRLPE